MVHRPVSTLNENDSHLAVTEHSASHRKQRL
nr:MAG TPA: hypothetical protein [Caudoviricetes sp.]